MREFSLILYL